MSSSRMKSRFAHTSYDAIYSHFGFNNHYVSDRRIRLDEHTCLCIYARDISYFELRYYGNTIITYYKTGDIKVSFKPPMTKSLLTRYNYYLPRELKIAMIRTVPWVLYADAVCAENRQKENPRAASYYPHVKMFPFKDGAIFNHEWSREHYALRMLHGQLEKPTPAMSETRYKREITGRLHGSYSGSSF